MSETARKFKAAGAVERLKYELDNESDDYAKVSVRGFDVRTVLDELTRTREQLAGQAPAEGSWQTEALALRAELAEVGEMWRSVRTVDEATDGEVRRRWPGLAARLDRFVHEGGETDR